MRLDLKLSQKGLILVLVPIVFELIFVVCLATLLKQAEEGMIKENHSRAVVTTAHDLQKIFYDAGAALSFYRMTRDDSFMRRYHTAIEQKIPDHLKKCYALMKDQEFELESYKKMEKATNEGVEELERCRVRLEEGTKQFFIVESRIHLEKLLRVIDDLIQKEREVQDRAPAAQTAARQTVVYFLFAGVAFSVLLGILLAMFFNSDIITRIKTMIANTRRVVKHEPLLPRVSGKDEIAQLDNVFHEMSEALDEASRYKQDMLAMVSHDLRSPLMSVQVSLALLNSGALGDLPKGASKEATVAEKNASRLIRMINDLLDIEKLESGRFELDLKEGDLLETIDRAVASIEALARAKNITIKSPDESVSAVFDADRIEQVFTNVLSNAVKFSPEDAEVNISLTKETNYVETRISDRGPGVPADKRESVFERFRQTGTDKEAEKAGSGLGLAIARALMSEHKGSIRVEENPGGGSVFVLTLPLGTVARH
ncbi:MAG TPA: HAMP domain-containing protein [Candidatus Melainabacteria bacterium]|jgi:signal transduction histidine kinase|nr:HAMP domain-containing protein [Candidatus Melainabacteria bacterium]HIN63211.1 HAMP domain-containing protein [Candidatus Obscuribacterales bacterium]